MPQEELTEAQFSELLTLLLSRREMLETQLSESSHALRPIALDQTLLGRVSRMDAIQQQEVTASTHRLKSIALQKVTNALALFKIGNFGYCRECDNPIGYKRLKAQPESALCLRCQTSLDSQQ